MRPEGDPRTLMFTPASGVPESTSTTWPRTSDCAWTSGVSAAHRHSATMNRMYMISELYAGTDVMATHHPAGVVLPEAVARKATKRWLRPGHGGPGAEARRFR